MIPRPVLDAENRSHRRFRIYRLPNITSRTQVWALWPWVLTDREHPERLERFATFPEAVRAVDVIARGEAPA